MHVKYTDFFFKGNETREFLGSKTISFMETLSSQRMTFKFRPVPLFMHKSSSTILRKKGNVQNNYKYND